jgi:hypothetical protein
MLKLDALSIPGVDFSAGTVTLTLWPAAVVAALVVVLLAATIFRAGSGAVVRVLAIAVAVGIAWVYFDRAAENDRAEARRALDQRLTLLTTQAISAGSILGCLDPNVGETVAGACEKALFAAPETVATATAYVAARVALLEDGTNFANHRDPTYQASLVRLRRAIEADRFGFVAQVLATRDGCTAAKCDALAMLSDAKRVNSNFNEHTYEGLVARNSVAWSARDRAGAPASAAAGSTFPPATPPVAAVSNEPPAPAPAQVPTSAGPLPAATPTPLARRRPLPRPAAARAQAGRAAAPQPVQLPPSPAGPASQGGSPRAQ